MAYPYVHAHVEVNCVHNPAEQIYVHIIYTLASCVDREGVARMTPVVDRMVELLHRRAEQPLDMSWAFMCETVEGIGAFGFSHKFNALEGIAPGQGCELLEVSGSALMNMMQTASSGSCPTTWVVIRQRMSFGCRTW